MLAGAPHAMHAASLACKLQGRAGRMQGGFVQPGITMFPQPPPRQYSPPLEARKVCGEKRRGEGRRGERGGGTHGREVKRGVRKDRCMGELKREKDREAGNEGPKWSQSGAGAGWG